MSSKWLFRSQSFEEFKSQQIKFLVEEINVLFFCNNDSKSHSWNCFKARIVEKLLSLEPFDS